MPIGTPTRSQSWKATPVVTISPVASGSRVVVDPAHAVVPMSQPKKSGTPQAEDGEGRPGIKENIAQPNMRPTQSGGSMPQGLSGVRRRAKERKQEKVTAHCTI